MSRQVSRGSAGEYQADEQVRVARLCSLVSVRGARTCRVAQLASIRQMSSKVWRGSACEYQADEQAGVAGLSWRVSGRPPISGALSELQPVELQQVRRTGDEPLFNSLMEQYHYLAYEQPVGEHLKYVA